MESNAYRAQMLGDIIDAKEKHGYVPLVLVEWKPRRREEHKWWSPEPIVRDIGGLPSGYVLLKEPTCRQVELYGVLKRTLPSVAADQIVPRHIVCDRVGIEKHPRSGIMHSLLDVLSRWSANDPLVLNPMLERERSQSSPLSDFILSHIYSIDPSFSEQNLSQLTYSQLMHKLFAVERTLSVASGGQVKPFQLVTSEMLREQQRVADKAKMDRIFQSATEEEEPPPPPPTLEEIQQRELERQTAKIRPVKSREFR